MYKFIQQGKLLLKIEEKNTMESNKITLGRQDVLQKSKKNIRIDSAQFKSRIENLRVNYNKNVQNLYDDQDGLPRSFKNIQRQNEASQSKKKITFVAQTALPSQKLQIENKDKIISVKNSSEVSPKLSESQIKNGDEKKPILKTNKQIKKATSINNSAHQSPKQNKLSAASPQNLNKQFKLQLEQHPVKNVSDSAQQIPLSAQIVPSSKSIYDNDNEFDRLSRKTRQTFRSNRSSCEDYLGHVFNYYCKLRYALDKFPTFQQINEKVNIMGITNFMVFCKQFNIRESVQRDKLVQVFKKHSSFHKYLNPDQFHSAVEQLSNIMFPTYEQDRRFGKMLVFLRIHNSFSFVRRMNQLGVAFRMKNKRGIDVNLAPKYEFKLTPYNGKSQDQIQTEVKQRSKIRKILKQQQIQLHQKNKTNKINQLYKKGKCHKNQNITLNQPVYKNTHRNKQNQNINSSNTGRSRRGYYNPCEILSTRSSANTYNNINKLKKQYATFGTPTQQPHERLTAQKSDYSSLPSQTREYKINDVIWMAKNTIIQQQAISKLYKNHGSIKHQQIRASQQPIPCSSIPEQLSQSTMMQSSFKCHKVFELPKKRNSKQIKYAEYMLQSEISNMPLTIYETNQKPKHFIRATANLQKQNTKQLRELQELIGVNEDKNDELLEQHFKMERNYQVNLSNISQTQ